MYCSKSLFIGFLKVLSRFSTIYFVKMWINFVNIENLIVLFMIFREISFFIIVLKAIITIITLHIANLKCNVIVLKT